MKKKSKFDDGYQYYQTIGMDGLEDIEQPSEIKMTKPIKKQSSSLDPKDTPVSYKYRYSGPVWKIQYGIRKLFSEHVDIETTASGLSKAINNIKFRISKDIFGDDKKKIPGISHVSINESLVRKIS